MISFSDFKDEKGEVDWNAYHRAQVAAGERCKQCEGHVSFFAKASGPALCASCKDLRDDPDDVTHRKLVRCPKCRHSQDPYPDYGGPSNHAMGCEEDDIQCNECEHKYRIGIRLTIDYKSPELEPESEEHR